MISKEKIGKFYISLIKKGCLDIESSKQKLGEKFAVSSIFMSNKHQSIVGLAKMEGVKHKRFEAKTHE